MAQAVSEHNSKLLREENQVEEQPGCNCRGGKCLTDNVIYEATVTETKTGSKVTYTGVINRQFKKRFYEHNTDMRKVKNRTKSCLSAHIWNLKDNGEIFTVSWKLKDRASSYNPTTKKSRICLKEKYHI